MPLFHGFILSLLLTYYLAFAILYLSLSVSLSLRIHTFAILYLSLSVSLSLRIHTFAILYLSLSVSLSLRIHTLDNGNLLDIPCTMYMHDAKRKLTDKCSILVYSIQFMNREIYTTVNSANLIPNLMFKFRSKVFTGSVKNSLLRSIYGVKIKGVSKGLCVSKVFVVSK